MAAGSCAPATSPSSTRTSGSAATRLPLPATAESRAAATAAVLANPAAGFRPVLWLEVIIETVMIRKERRFAKEHLLPLRRVVPVGYSRESCHRQPRKTPSLQGRAVTFGPPSS